MTTLEVTVVEGINLPQRQGFRKLPVITGIIVGDKEEVLTEPASDSLCPTWNHTMKIPDVSEDIKELTVKLYAKHVIHNRELVDETNVNITRATDGVIADLWGDFAKGGRLRLRVQRVTSPS